MKFISGAKRAAKFTLVDMPLSILGWRQLKANHGFISNLWHTLRNPRCPECGCGVMHLPADAQPDDNTLYGWECSAKCGFGVFAPADQIEIRRIFEARIAERGKQRLAFLGDARAEQAHQQPPMEVSRLLGSRLACDPDGRLATRNRRSRGGRLERDIDHLGGLHS